jgi:long-chain acyl-CoA synthetase
MEKIWLKNYPPGVPAEINPDEYSSLNELFDVAVSRYQDRPAFTNMGRTLTFVEMDRKADAFAAWAADRGLRKGDRLAIMLPNVLQYPIALIGALRAGLTIVNVNPLYTPHELEHQLIDSGAKAIVVLENFASILQKVIAKTSLQIVIVTGVGDMLHWPKGALVNFVLRRIRKQVPAYDLPGAISFRAALNAGAFMPAVRVALSHHDIAFLQYTGGTTGVAKGAMLSHRNMIANVVQSTAWIGDSNNNQSEIAVAALPLYHIFSLTANTLAFVKRGAQILLITNPRDFPGFIRELSRYRFTFLSGVNTLFNALLHTPGFDRLDFSSLTMTLGGGMAVQAAVAERWKKATGNVLTQAWGLTETSPGVCINPFRGQEFNGSIGLPIPST